MVGTNKVGLFVSAPAQVSEPADERDERFGDATAAYRAAAPTEALQPVRNIAQRDEAACDEARDFLLRWLAPQLRCAHACFAVGILVQKPAELVGGLGVAGGKVFGHCRDEFLAAERSVAGQGAGECQADFHGAFMLREERATPV
jgi:hypothetical protein